MYHGSSWGYLRHGISLLQVRKQTQEPALVLKTEIGGFLEISKQVFPWKVYNMDTKYPKLPIIMLKA